MLLSCIGQRSLSNSGVLEGLLNLLDTLLSPLQQTAAAQLRRTEGVFLRVRFLCNTHLCVYGKVTILCVCL